MRNNPDYSKMTQKELATAYLQGYAAFKEADQDEREALRSEDTYYGKILPLLSEKTKQKYLTMRAVVGVRSDGSRQSFDAPEDVNRVRAMSRRNPTSCVDVVNAVNRAIRAKGLQFDGSVVPYGADMDLKDLRNQHIGVTLTISGGRASLSGDVAGGSFDLNGGVDEQARTIVYNLQDILKHMGRRNPSEYWKKNIQKALKAHQDRLGYVLGDIYAAREDRDLSGLDLSGADLSYSDLMYADLRGANLYGANLSHAYLVEADLRGANLSWTNLTSANLVGANLKGANITQAGMLGALIYNTTMPDGRQRGFRDPAFREPD
jgi:uncharacterized protein YjbI with pentapeptide repeats